jgi:hypothetical protein
MGRKSHLCGKIVVREDILSDEPTDQTLLLEWNAKVIVLDVQVRNRGAGPFVFTRIRQVREVYEDGTFAKYAEYYVHTWQRYYRKGGSELRQVKEWLYTTWFLTPQPRQIH